MVDRSEKAKQSRMTCFAGHCNDCSDHATFSGICQCPESPYTGQHTDDSMWCFEWKQNRSESNGRD